MNLLVAMVLPEISSNSSSDSSLGGGTTIGAGNGGSPDPESAALRPRATS